MDIIVSIIKIVYYKYSRTIQPYIRTSTTNTLILVPDSSLWKWFSRVRGVEHFIQQTLIYLPEDDLCIVIVHSSQWKSVHFGACFNRIKITVCNKMKYKAYHSRKFNILIGKQQNEAKCIPHKYMPAAHIPLRHKYMTPLRHKYMTAVHLPPKT